MFSLSRYLWTYFYFPDLSFVNHNPGMSKISPGPACWSAFQSVSISAKIITSTATVLYVIVYRASIDNILNTDTFDLNAAYVGESSVSWFVR